MNSSNTHSKTESKTGSRPNSRLSLKARTKAKAAPTTKLGHAAIAPAAVASNGVALAPAGSAHGAHVSGRKASAVDSEIKAAALRRLTLIEGQVRGLHKMVESERYCADILVQISSVQQALRGVSHQLMRNHLRHCASDTIRESPAAAESMYDELLSLIYRHAL